MPILSVLEYHSMASPRMQVPLLMALCNVNVDVMRLVGFLPTNLRNDLDTRQNALSARVSHYKLKESWVWMDVRVQPRCLYLTCICC